MKMVSINEVIKMRFLDIYGQYEKSKITCEEAAAILGLSVSSFYRKRQTYEEEGVDCKFGKRVGRASPHRTGCQVLTINLSCIVP